MEGRGSYRLNGMLKQFPAASEVTSTVEATLSGIIITLRCYFRYSYQQVSIEVYTTNIIRENLNRRQTLDGASRNLLKLIISTAGYSEVRTLAMQRLEIWLQNPKVTC